MDTRDDGGNAFPSWDFRVASDVGGMSLRDYFAAKVLAALVASEPDEACISTTGDGIAQEQAAYRERQARFAYLYADAMIAERAK